ncbi:hypothetical protein [Streptomyces odonnellii]|uniref:hypothetical protein n=1 Tax=Streptomyces odonnellii TaxID=1417980 RepID=UPI0006253D6E|nr:hypothetical protein [Streptomyces odonnellii]
MLRQLPDRSEEAARGRVRFSLTRWVLTARTTWQARRRAAAYGPGMDARTARATVRLSSHPEDYAYLLRHLDGQGTVVRAVCL